jgi:hypothetical protein
MRRIKPEAAVQKCVTDYLTAKRILFFRMNSGAVVSEYKGKSRMIRYGTPGMSDLVAFPLRWDKPHTWRLPGIIWLEVKAPNGVQSDAQKSFQALVESNGHRYAIVRSLEDLEAVLWG